MNLTMLPKGQNAIIMLCKAKEATKRFLEGLGIIPGASISVVSEIKGNLIIKIKGVRVAVSKGIAQQVFVKLN